jgi:uncharacterized protein YjiS (DUF1127 family)
MSTTHGSTWLERTSISTRHVSSFIWNYWDAFQERRQREKLRAALSDLSDRELMDIGSARGEIDYIASRRGQTDRAIPSPAGSAPPSKPRGVILMPCTRANVWLSGDRSV